MTTLVSYQGGSAGDLLTASLNNIQLAFDQLNFVRQPDFTLKGKLFKTVDDLTAAISEKPYTYLSTHEFNFLLNTNIDWVSIEITNPEIQELCILRQMKIQRLFIEVNPLSHWFRTTKTLCDSGEYIEAADYWFSQARNLWLTEATHRLNTQVPKRINFNSLFSDNFYDSIVAQGYSVPALKENHSRWLQKNSASTWSKESTLQTMALKLSQMDWHATSGIIRYNGS